MTKFHRTSLVDQTAEFLRDGIRTGRWKARLPGVRKLAEELDVSRRTLLAATKLLRDEGWLDAKSTGVAHTIVERSGTAPAAHRSLRVAMLIPGALERHNSHIREMLLRIITQARIDGHDAFIVATPVGKDQHKTGYLEKLVKEAKADAWLVHHASLETLRWFMEKQIPVLAMGGRSNDLPIASASFPVAGPMRELVRRLTGLGHRRIVLIVSDLTRRPTFSPMLTAYREELEACGITPGEYNSPDWEETPEGLEALMQSLFAVTPPTAIICWHLNVTVGVLSFFARKGLRTPEDASLFFCGDDPSLAWHVPGMQMARFDFDEDARLKHIRRWVEDLSNGRPQTHVYDKPFGIIEGTTIGPAKKNRPEEATPAGARPRH